MDVTRPDRRIVTFYSFKGGVGRSMALANVAFRLADRHDLNVIIVDWDLEAPGLHRFFGIPDEEAATKSGLLEYLLAWREAVEEGAESPPDATGWLIPVPEAHKPQHGSLSLLLAGQLDEGYADRLRGFDWQPFYRFNAGAAAIETLRKQLAGKADMVLIDSRTGVTDAGGVCTIQMPDGVVLMTAANEQSFEGIERVARAISSSERDRTGRERVKVWVAVGRAPYLDVPEGESWFDKYGPRFEEGYETALWTEDDHPRGLRSHRLPHVGRWGFGEQLLDTRLENDDPLAVAYGVLSDALLQWAIGKEPQVLSNDKTPTRTIEELRNTAEQAELRFDLARLDSALLELAGALVEIGDLTSAVEMIQKAAGVQLGRGQRLDNAFTLVFLGQVLRNQGRFDEAIIELNRAFTIFREVNFSSGESLALGAMAAAFHSGDRKDLDVTEGLYQSSIEADPENADALGDYADFLLRNRKSFDKAEEFYIRAIEVNPRHANNLGNYATFLTNVRKDFDKAEEFYKHAIKEDPKHANNLGKYALFLSNIRKDFDKAETLYERAIALDPRNFRHLGNYADFMSSVRKDFDKAEELYQRALKSAPRHANLLRFYASFLTIIRKDFDKAEELYQRALKASPKHIQTLRTYAFFLLSIRKDLDKASELYERAIEAAPHYAPTLGVYALLLWSSRKDFDKAEELFERAIKEDAKNATNLGSYANFLSRARKDFDKAENLYNRAVEIGPKHANNLGYYAEFLSTVRKDFVKAEEFYKRAIEADPKHANHLGDYATYLSGIRKDFVKAEEFYKRAIEADPKHANHLGNYAGMLLAIGRQTDGLSLLDRALDVADSSNPQKVECWFYALTHRAPEQRAEALAQLKHLIITEGARSPGWDLSGNVERARIDGHPDAAWLALLADVIAEKADPAVLDAWSAWTAA